MEGRTWERNPIAIHILSIDMKNENETVAFEATINTSTKKTLVVTAVIDSLPSHSRKMAALLSFECFIINSTLSLINCIVFRHCDTKQTHTHTNSHT